MFEFDVLLMLGLKVLFALLMIGAVMTMAGYSVLAERKVSAWMQGRVGPNRTVLPLVGHIPFLGSFLRGLGMFQPLADGLKFLFKEEIIPGHVNKLYYNLAPIVALVPALTTMTVLPFGEFFTEEGKSVPLMLANLEVGILFVLAVSSLGVYGIVLAGWSSNSKYPFLGGIRSSAQMISYELAMGLSLLPIFLWVSVPGTGAMGLSLVDIVNSQSNGAWLVLVQPLSAFIFLIAFVHIIHVLVALLFLIYILVRDFYIQINSQNLIGLELASIFWHFVDILWIYLFIFLVFFG